MPACHAQTSAVVFVFHVFMYVNMLLCRLVAEPLVFLLQCLCWSHSVSLLFLIVCARSAIFQSRQNVDPEIKAWTKESSGRHNNRSSHCFRRQHRARPLYDNSTATADITSTQELHTDTSAANQIQPPLTPFQHFGFLVSFDFLSFHPGCSAGLFCSSVLPFSSVQVRLDQVCSQLQQFLINSNFASL